MHWDEPSQFSGGNSADACMVFDSDSDGNVNNALCASILRDPNVSSFNDPNAFVFKGDDKNSNYLPRYYSCKDTTVDNCAKDGNTEQDITLATFGSANLSSVCSIAVESSDPFPFGSDHPSDIVVTCTIDVDAIPVDALPWNMCSFNSSSFNSNASECVIEDRPGNGDVAVTKTILQRIVV